MFLLVLLTDVSIKFKDGETELKRSECNELNTSEQMSWKRKLATVKGKRADVSSVSPSSNLRFQLSC